MKKVFRLKSIIYGLIAILLITTALSLGCAKKEKEIKIGWIGPLTGDVAYYGQAIKDATDLAVAEINKEGGIQGIKIRVIYEDDQVNPKLGTAAMRKLINIHKVPIAIQAAGSSVMLANAPIAGKNRVVLISPTCSNRKIKDAGDYVFRIWPSDAYQGNVIANFSYNTLNAKNAGVLYINNDYGLGLKDVFVERFGKLGGTITGIETFSVGETDFRTHLTKIASKSPSVVLLASHYKEAALVLKQAANLGLRFQFIGGDGCFAPELISLSGGASEGMIVTNMEWSPESKEKIVYDFVSAYKEKCGKAPEVYAAAGYDCMKVIALAVKNGGTVSSGIRDALYKIKDYKGVTGRITFDEYGEVVGKEYQEFVVKNGKFVQYDGD